MLFHCILASERPSLSNLSLMLFLDPQGQYLDKTAMIKSEYFPVAFNIGLTQKRLWFSWFKKQEDKYTLCYDNAMAKKKTWLNVVDVIKSIITSI